MGFSRFEEYQIEINNYRSGKMYCDSEAAKRVLHSAEKSPLLEDPFIRLFEYGNAEGKEGYWNYDHMMIQVEDVVDVLFVVYGTKFDIVLLLDHSCKNRMRPDALNVHAMNVGFGGKQSSIMHPS